MKSLTYSAPIPVTLAGSAGAPFGGSVLMIALDPGVRLEVTVKSGKKCAEEYEKLVEIVEAEIFGKAEASKYIVKITHSYSGAQRSVQAACIVGLTAALLELKNGEKPSHEHIQKLAYQADKKFFKQHSYAQTVVSAGGGIVFYRKEFVFYKTVMKLPMKLPEGFLKGISIVHGMVEESEKGSYDRIVRQLVFAIQTESTDKWQELIDSERGIGMGDMTLQRHKSTSLQENHSGVRRLST